MAQSGKLSLKGQVRKMQIGELCEIANFNRSKMKTVGMTLVELVVALSIATLLFGGLAMVFRAIQLSERTCDEQLKLIRVAQAALERISTDLRCCYPMRVQIPQELLSGRGSTTATRNFSLLPQSATNTSMSEMPSSIITFLTEDNYNEQMQLEQDSLRFTTAVNDPRSHNEPSYDVVEVAYYIDVDQKTPEEGLVRAVGLLPGLLSEQVTGKEQKKAVLSKNIYSLNLRYFDDSNSQWLDEWYDFEKLPSMVEVTIGVLTDADVENVKANKPPSNMRSYVSVVPIVVRSIPTGLTYEELNQSQVMEGAQEQQISR
ncbi:MAG: hypothetical protein RUDDFDWM_000357 [Candidatus Fervidibacterota bacterium]